jgi:hypothetical protein
MALITQPTNVPSEWFELARESFYYSITKGRHTAARQPIGKNLVHDLPAKRSRSVYSKWNSKRYKRSN